MKRIFVLLTFLPPILIFSSFAVIAEPIEKEVGVQVGDWVLYEWHVDVVSNDPSPPKHTYYNFENREEKVIVQKITGTNVTLIIQTDDEEIIWIDVDSGESIWGGYGWGRLIASNLTSGDSLYSQVHTDYRINETIACTYVGETRETNHIRIVRTSYPSINSTYTTDIYWDKITGFLVETYFNTTTVNGTYVTYEIDSAKVIDTNLWGYRKLLTTYENLLDDHDYWVDEYSSLNSTYNNLASSYTSLQADYDYLHGKYDALLGELNTIKNLMYVFIITTMVFISATVYLAMRKPEEKPELKTT